jgi:pimeloyl-ACP methyl ester carboxylesterase
VAAHAAVAEQEERSMKTASINGVQLEYEVKGEGEPVLFISPGPVASAFFPLLDEPALTGFRLVCYHRRGQAGAMRSDTSISFGDHAADAAALLHHLGISRAHVAGHSTGGAVALQLAKDRGDVIHSLALLEPVMSAVPSAAGFFEDAGPWVEAYACGDRETAVTGFISFVSGVDWETCRSLLDQLPGGARRVLQDTDFFFGSDLPALNAWRFDADDASAFTKPVLSVLGAGTLSFFLDGHRLLESYFPQLQTSCIEDAGHLLQIERPEAVARGLAAFVSRHPMQSLAAV